MTTVFVDPRVLTMHGEAPVASSSRPFRDSAGLVRHLVDSGHRVILVRARAQAGAADGTVPVDPESFLAAVPAGERGWLVTADVAACREARQRAGLRTVFVGPLEPGVGLAHRPADVEARDLADAVMTILTSEAMPDTHP